MGAFHRYRRSYLKFSAYYTCVSSEGQRCRLSSALFGYDTPQSKRPAEITMYWTSLDKWSIYHTKYHLLGNLLFYKYLRKMKEQFRISSCLFFYLSVYFIHQGWRTLKYTYNLVLHVNLHKMINAVFLNQ